MPIEIVKDIVNDKIELIEYYNSDGIFPSDNEKYEYEILKDLVNKIDKYGNNIYYLLMEKIKNIDIDELFEVHNLYELCKVSIYKNIINMLEVN